MELAGPQSISGTGNTSGYVPCYYTAPRTGVYDVVFFGPNTTQGNPDGSINNFSTDNNSQGNSVAAWDVTVRSNDINSTQDFPGRLFTYYLTLFTGGNRRFLNFSIYPVTNDGYQYRITLRGLDPDGFVVYGNQVGFFDSDGKTPLYRDVIGGDENLADLESGVSLARPQFATFLNLPNQAALSAVTRYDINGNQLLGSIPLIPVRPSVSDLKFLGKFNQNTSVVNQGGTFTFNSSIAGNYQLVISRDGIDFDPTNPNNRALRGVMFNLGIQSVDWNGQDNSGVAFPVGTYPARIRVHAGEYHFPLLDAENNVNGGPTIELLNETNPLGRYQAFYDDRGYRTLAGTTVGTVGQVLCAATGTTRPSPPASNAITGFDSRGSERSFGVSTNTPQPNQRCGGSFGNTKGLDIWTYFPSNTETAPVRIIDNPSANLRLVKRITALNNIAYTDVIDDPADSSDDSSRNWTMNYIVGRTGKGITAADSVPVKPGDSLEYTIYFLSDGSSAAQNVTICDLIPPNTTFIPNTFNTSTPKDSPTSAGNFGMQLTIDSATVYLSNADDVPDRGQFFAPGTAAPCGANGASVIVPNGAIMLKLNNLPHATTKGTPNSFGFIRFRARVN
ncbi:DUF11 domain-containing protein [Cyanobacteria bacterium FACHB-DQ100]|nr:DUF11 domain-containing protein [Cyanobacteria bacterium FACHB-DQ100]